jgi:type I restriction enzyme M protein
MIRADLLDAVIGLPGGILYPMTSIPVALLVFQRDRPNADERGTPGPVLMIDVPNLTGGTERSPTLDKASAQKIAEQYDYWLRTGQTMSGCPSALVSYTQLVENDFAIEPRRYTASKVDLPSSTERSTERTALETELRTLLNQAHDADIRLSRLFKGDR